jgi:hypothetical protein
MQELTARIVDCIKTSSLPSDGEALFADLYDSEINKFVLQECTYFDYKGEFPFSFSGEYFGGILRLICALYNTYGGLIIFGVQDSTREPGHNKVKINIERLNNVVRTVASFPVELVHREYDFAKEKEKSRKIDVILVPKRPMAVPPLRLKVAVGGYKSGVIWMRVGHEVIAPTSRDLPGLYSSREDFGIGGENALSPIEAALPPSPATLKEFIGRRDALDRLYTWLFSSDEPRVFLFGKGGSGKSTIAYEFARMVSESGGNIPTKAGQPIDYVVYLSAKSAIFEPISRTIIKNSSHDFSNVKELYQAILTLAGWTDPSRIETSDEAELIKELQGLFNTVQLLVVIDDIDTLTTAGRDPGMDTLYRILLRASGGGKVVYTLRNAPTQSLANAIEVPGLEIESELSEFVAACCKQFKVKEPDKAFETGHLSRVTERRPLAVEVLIGLRRTAGSYKDALQLFQGRQGDQVREYLFQREYLALPGDNKARLFLAALALLDRAASFGELESILQFSKDQLNDCVSQTLEMFLQSTQTAPGETTYSLGEATQQFIKHASRELEMYEKMKANVQYFKSPFAARDPVMRQIEFEVGRLFKGREFQRATEVLTRNSYPPSVTEHPGFNILKGRAFAKLTPPKYEEARAAFRFGASHGSTDLYGFRDWYWMEKNSGFGQLKAIEVCDTVIELKGLPSEAKAEFYSKKALVLRDMAVNSFFVDPEKSIAYQIDELEAIFQSLEMYELAPEETEQFASRTREFLREAFRYLFISTARLLDVERRDLIDSIFRFFSEHVRKKKYCFDVVEEPLVAFLTIMSRPQLVGNTNRNRSIIQRTKAMYEAGAGLMFKDEAVREKILVIARIAEKRLTPG